MTDAEFQRLKDEVLRANQAEQSYNSFIRSFIAEKKQRLFEAFESLPSNDIDGLKELKLMSLSLTALETEIQSIIDTGKLARETLSQNEVH